MTQAFETAAGTATGADHVWAGRPNQDAWCLRHVAGHTLIAVADGCSDSAHAEVGAWLGVHAAAEVLCSEVWSGDPDAPFTLERLEYVRREILARVEQALSLMGGAGGVEMYGTSARRRLLNDFFLFTLVVGVIGPEHTTFAAIGDGYLCVNGVEVDLGTFEKNMPPYLAYSLTTTSLPPEALRFRVLSQLSTAVLQNFVVGTDGVRDLAAAAEQVMPGRESNPSLPASQRLVGPMSQFWTADRYFTNTDMVRRKLVMCNGGIGPRAVAGGLLRDDTTLVVGRRKAVPSCSP